MKKHVEYYCILTRSRIEEYIRVFKLRRAESERDRNRRAERLLTHVFRQSL